MTRPARHLSLCVLALTALLILAGCGNKLEVRTLGATEGLYIDVGQLKYQVQNSRILNPNDIEDRTYLQGLDSSEAPPNAQQTWFAIFVRVQNTGKRALPSARDFSIIDTLAKRYTPVRITNPFVYQPMTLQPKGLIPQPDSIAADGVIQGSLLLFRVDLTSLQNRPLEFHIANPANAKELGIVDLDV